jgi:hypothetical protein
MTSPRAARVNRAWRSGRAWRLPAARQSLTRAERGSAAQP